MQQVKFANVLLESNPRSFSYPSLYCRSTAPVFFERNEKVWEMYGPGEFDFTTYFNSLSIKKLIKYTVAKSFHLHLEFRGAACDVFQTMADAFSTVPEKVEGVSFSLPESQSWQTLDFELKVDSNAIVLGFIVESQGSVSIRNSYYYVDIEDDAINNIDLVLATTTFKKEDFIVPNIALVRKDIMYGEPEMAEHFRMLVVDNGRTLDKNELDGNGITVFPNPNAGGAGGFARGMIEAQRLPVPATHVLLMDDDVAVSPESIKRTYQLLRLLKPEYSEAFISGAMMNYEVGEDQWEDFGYMTPEGRFSGCKPGLRMSLLHDIVMNEQYVPTQEQRDNMYAAWWYCVIPTSVIQREGYPLPVFVRCDDAEYGIRCHPKIISMNGICIWHLAFHSRYSAAVERYQTTRNTLIAQATTGMSPKSDFLKELHNNLQIELKKFNYTDAELLLDGFEDFMRGPEFIGKPVAEDSFMRANRNAEKLVSFDELRELTKDIEDFDLDDEDCLSIYRDEPRTRAQALVDFVTFNRQRVMKGTESGSAVIPSEGWIYSPGKIRGKDTLIAIDTFRRKGIVRHRDINRFNAIMKRYRDDIAEYRKNKAALEKAYSDKRSWLTSEEFWKEYLGIS